MIADPNPGGFYVYQLADPRTDLPFYVGKGQRFRAWAHEISVRQGDLKGNARKVAKIQEIIARGDTVMVQIVACYDLESDALDHEFRLVDADPTLTNIMPGGIGAPLSDAETARRISARLKRLKDLRRRERLANADVEIAQRRAALVANGRSEAEKAQIAAWADSLGSRESRRTLAPYHDEIERRMALREEKNKAAVAREGHKRKRGRRGRSMQRMQEGLSEMEG